MTADAEAREKERARIQNAAAALISGEADGPLTVTRLADLAGLKRWKLTHRHTDLKADFQAAAGWSPTGIANRDALEASLETERETNDALRAELRQLEEHLHRYATVVSELAADLAEAQARVEALSSVRKLRPRA